MQDDQYVLEVRVKDPGDSFSWASQYAGSIQAIGYLFLLRGFLGAAEWIAISTGKLLPRQSDKEKLAEDMGKSIAKAYNVGKGGKGTGVKFDDVAGIDSVKGDIRDILRMLLGAKEFKEMGARVPRGILLEGPPGTGKTYLAKAMADEAGIPFYSANGAEFVQVRACPGLPHLRATMCVYALGAFTARPAYKDSVACRCGRTSTIERSG